MVPRKRQLPERADADQGGNNTRFSSCVFSRGMFDARFGENCREPLRGKVRPEVVNEGQAGMRRLPEQEIRQTFLAAGPNHQVRRWKVGGIEMRRKIGRGDRRRRRPARRLPGGISIDRIPRSRRGHRSSAPERDSDVCYRRGFGNFRNFFAHPRWENIQTTDGPKTDAVLV